MKTLVIDGTNLRAGGGVTHIVEVLNNIDISKFQFQKVIIFSNKNTLSKIHDQDFIEKRTHFLLNKGLFFILFWKLFYFEKFLKSLDSRAVLLDPAGTYSGSFHPFVSMSRNMLIFEKDESDRFQEWSMRKRFQILRTRQIKTFENADGIIFISKYAKEVILPYLERDSVDYQLINHGVSKRFKNLPVLAKSSNYNLKNPFHFIYVSPITVYKHQKVILEAFSRLRKDGENVKITFIGDYYEPEYKEFLKIQNHLDADRKFSSFIGKIPYHKLDSYYKEADGIIFGSTCENMPNILIESMISGKPLISSNKQPMSEFLSDNFPFGIDPTNINSIISTVKKFLNDPEMRYTSAVENFNKADTFNWDICSLKTFSYLNKFIK